MVEAFATVEDLALILNRTFSEAERPWITELLRSASTYLREDVIGAQIFPQSTVTFAARPSNREVELPQQPVVRVDSVKLAGSAIDFEEYDGYVAVGTNERVDVTFTYGYAFAPEGLKRWTCVLVSQALIPLELKLGLTVGGLSSVAIDDFKAAFADGGEQTGMELSDRNIENLRRQYAQTVHVGGTR